MTRCEQSNAPKLADVSVYVDYPAEVLGNVPVHASFVGQGIQQAARLVDMPTNELHTDAYVEEARVVAERLGSSIRVSPSAIMPPSFP